MRHSRITIGVAGAAALTLLAGCSENIDQSAGGDTAEVATEAPAHGDMAVSSDAGGASLGGAGDIALHSPGTLPVGQPKLAYTYDYAYRLAGDGIGPLQRRHADLCEQQGPASCRIIGMTRAGHAGEAVTGELKLAVATRHARAFGALLEDVAEDAGAEQLSADIASEELSKAIVDTEAHLAARTELRDRLMQVSRTRKGSVSELVEAERNIAQVNEEIDRAKSWLREMQGRVAYTTVTVRYETATPVGTDFVAPIQGALGSLGSVAGFVVAALILLGAAALPVIAVILGARAISRRYVGRALSTGA